MKNKGNFLLCLAGLFLVACSNESLIVSEDSQATIDSLQQKFDLDDEYDSESNYEYDTYFKKYDLSREISVYLDEDDELGIVSFLGVNREDAFEVLNELDIDENDQVTDLINSTEDLDEKYLFVEESDFAYHIVNIGDELAESMNIEGPINIFVILDEALYEQFETID